MINQPLITIVIPTYNRIEFVQQAIASVIAQTYIHWELIIVDDGSYDGTAGTINSMNDSHIKVLQLKHSGNIAYLRNTGVKAGSGEWLAFLDSDDLWVPQKLEIQLNHLMREGKQWGYGGFELINNEMQPIPNRAGMYRPVSGWIAKEVLSTEASVNIGTLMIKRSLFEETGGFNENAELIFREDYELVIRLALKEESQAIPDILVRVREHGGRSTNAFQHGHDRTAIVYERFLQTNPDKELAKIARLRMAHEFAEGALKRIRERNYSEATRRLWKAFLNGDRWRHLLSVIRRGI